MPGILKKKKKKKKKIHISFVVIIIIIFFFGAEKCYCRAKQGEWVAYTLRPQTP